MKLFVGLNNPGEKYMYTRHNAGAIVLDQLCVAEGCTHFLPNKKFHGQVANGLIGKWQILALKPHTFMNKSGVSIQSVIHYYNISLDDVLIIHDDIDLPFGKIKIKYGGSHGGHNGIKDTINKLGTEKFWRLKIGVGRPEDPRYDVVSWVLQSFSSTELQWFVDHEKDIREKIGDYLKNTG